MSAMDDAESVTNSEDEQTQEELKQLIARLPEHWLNVDDGNYLLILSTSWSIMILLTTIIIITKN
jgi:hypothetical protein